MSHLDYTPAEIAAVANEHNLDITEVEKMMDEGYDPDTMVLDLDDFDPADYEEGGPAATDSGTPSRPSSGCW